MITINRLTAVMLLAICYFGLADAQDVDCIVFTRASPIFLDGNYISAPIGPEPTNYSSSNRNGYAVETPEGDKPTILVQSPWMTGIDTDGNIRTSFNTYSPFSPAFSIGPLNANGKLYTDCLDDFNRVWEARRAQIEAHISDFADNGQIDTPIEDILGWPGFGNTHFFDIYGLELPTINHLAPFKDLDGDGIYEPLDGEYPVEPHEESIPQHITWEVHNTLLTNPNISLDASISAEIHHTQWTYFCTDLELLNTTAFNRYEIFHRGDTELTAFRFGLWSHFQLGCSVDNYVGCDSSRNSYFVYNNGNIDGEVCGGNDDRYFGENPPVQAVTFLNQPMSSFVAQLNYNEILPSELLRADNKQEIFNNLHGLLADGSSITNIGLGDMEDSGEETVFHFHGNPNNPDEWSMEGVGFSELETWFGLGAIEVGNWQAEDMLVIDIANTYYREPGNNNLENVQAMYEGLDQLQNLYDNGFSVSCTPLNCIDDCVWPGDLNNDGIANCVDLIALGFGYEETGPIRDLPVMWAPLPAESWGDNQIFIEQPDLKHLDADNDGEVSGTDLNIINDYYGFVRPDYDPSLNQTFLEGLDVKFTKPNGSTFDEEISHGIIIGQVSLYSPFEDLVGIALELEYDPDFFEYFETSPSGSDNFGVANENIGWMSRRSSDSTFDISRYNFNGAFELNERFSLQRFYFQRANSLLGDVPDFSEITFKNIRGWLADGTEVALGGQTVLFRL
ncbi:MAG: hypothetical protein AAGF87_13605, partial [Bacteroidota bacterium]